MIRPEPELKKLQRQIATDIDHRSFLIKRTDAIEIFNYIEELEQELESKK